MFPFSARFCATDLSPYKVKSDFSLHLWGSYTKAWQRPAPSDPGQNFGHPRDSLRPPPTTEIYLQVHFFSFQLRSSVTSHARPQWPPRFFSHLAFLLSQSSLYLSSGLVLSLRSLNTLWVGDLHPTRCPAGPHQSPQLSSPQVTSLDTYPESH